MVRTLEYFQAGLDIALVLKLKAIIPERKAAITNLSPEKENGLVNFSVGYTGEHLQKFVSRSGRPDENTMSRFGDLETPANLGPLIQMLPSRIGPGASLGKLETELRNQQLSGNLLVGAYVDNNQVLGVSLYFKD
jgi:hypothetical protein